ncbi:MAG: hypothetical protein M0021_09570 [Clostridia bacterium]|nr:hypothetical protein [Clostridia bacterium]
MISIEWGINIIRGTDNEWVIYELCKGIEETGAFDNLSRAEAYDMVKTIAQAHGATLGAIRNGWEEYLCSVQGRRNIGELRRGLKLAQ